jgi:hypothetical protein
MTHDDSRMRVTHIMRPAIAGTARGTLDLLALPLPFTQVALLTPEEFVKETNEDISAPTSDWTSTWLGSKSSTDTRSSCRSSALTSTGQIRGWQSIPVPA